MSNINQNIGLSDTKGVICSYKPLWLLELYEEIDGGKAIQLDERGTDYKYDFLENRNIDGDVGFIPHCDRPDWNET